MMFDCGKKFNLESINSAYELKNARNFVRFVNKKELEKFLDDKYQDEEIKKSERKKYFSFIYYAHKYCGISFFKKEQLDPKSKYYLDNVQEPDYNFADILHHIDFIRDLMNDGVCKTIDFETSIEFIHRVRKRELKDIIELRYAFEVSLKVSKHISYNAYDYYCDDSDPVYDCESDSNYEYENDLLYSITESDSSTDSLDDTSYDSSDDNSSLDYNNSSSIDFTLSEKLIKLLKKLEEN